VFPGAVATNIQAHSGVKNARTIDENISEEELKKYATLPRDAAEAIVSGMEAGKWKILIGKECKQMDWLMRLAPGFAIKKMASAIKKLYSI
jgi:short-subunit dehydrogenase